MLCFHSQLHLSCLADKYSSPRSQIGDITKAGIGHRRSLAVRDCGARCKYFSSRNGAHEYNDECVRCAFGWSSASSFLCLKTHESPPMQSVGCFEKNCPAGAVLSGLGIHPCMRLRIRPSCCCFGHHAGRQGDLQVILGLVWHSCKSIALEGDNCRIPCVRKVGILYSCQEANHSSRP